MPATVKVHSTKIVETATGFSVEMILSDAADLEQAGDVIQLRAKLDTVQKDPHLLDYRKAPYLGCETQ
jgi:hypothetical protein